MNYVLYAIGTMIILIVYLGSIGQIRPYVNINVNDVETFTQIAFAAMGILAGIMIISVGVVIGLLKKIAGHR